MKDVDLPKAIHNEEIIIAKLDEMYENGDDCIHPFSREPVTDSEYDAIKRKLFLIYPESQVFNKVVSGIKGHGRKKIKHDPPMTSIDKCNGTEEEKGKILKKWLGERIPLNKIKDKNLFCMSLKYDGVALSLTYKDGKLQTAALRSDGIMGEEVTASVKNIDGISLRLPIPISCTIRGEVICLKSKFVKVNEKLEQMGMPTKANPRNHAAGVLHRENSDEVKDMGLEFVAYNIINFEDAPYKTEIERANWAVENLNLNYIRIVPFDFFLLEKWEETHRQLDFLVDGVVIAANNIEHQEGLGTVGSSVTGNPKGKIAYKFADEVKQVIVKDVVWDTGRTGHITPVLHFDGVNLEGTVVSKCTAHNAGVIINDKIGIGSIIEVIKSGKIIPKLKRVVKSKGFSGLPDKCPVCDSFLHRVNGKDGAQSLFCENSNCASQMMKNVIHYLNIIGVKGVGEYVLNKISEHNSCLDINLLYSLSYQQLIDEFGISPRTALLTVARIHMIKSAEKMEDDELKTEIKRIFDKKKKIPIATFFAALGIKEAGKEAGKLLSSHFGSWASIRSSSATDLENIAGIGPVSAKNICKFFNDLGKGIDDLLKNHIELELPLKGILTGKSFVFTGGFTDGKKKWQLEVEKAGGQVKGSVSKQVDFVIVGTDSGNKSKKAKELGIKTIDINELQNILKD